jgi:hypothetical protein
MMIKLKKRSLFGAEQEPSADSRLSRNRQQLRENGQLSAAFYTSTLHHRWKTDLTDCTDHLLFLHNGIFLEKKRPAVENDHQE